MLFKIAFLKCFAESLKSLVLLKVIVRFLDYKQTPKSVLNEIKISI